MSESATWLALAGLGAFHGLNPGMGWLYAVALGLHRQDRRIVWLAPIAIALGHAASVGAATAFLLWAGFAFEARGARLVTGLALIGWAVYHWRYGHRHRVRFGMQVGLVGLGLWSFLMATAHGAGLMLWPVLLPLCISPNAGAPSADPLPIIVAGLALHTLAMLLVTAVIAVAVYEWIGLEVLRRAWINVDLLWTAALIVAGVLLLAAG